MQLCISTRLQIKLHNNTLKITLQWVQMYILMQFVQNEVAFIIHMVKLFVFMEHVSVSFQ